MGSEPFFSIVTVTFDDVWAMTKTARSVFEQTEEDLEYVVVDGASRDETAALIDFWTAAGLVTRSVSEPDTGVYDAMNKALRLARGRYVCFLNSSDVFASAEVLAQVRGHLEDGTLDGLMGWGELNGQLWTSWAETPAFRMASLGFCHQALFVRRELLVERPFDQRRFKTDSDTQQLASLYEAGGVIAILPEVLGVLGGEPGLSANLERTAVSIRATLTEGYPRLSETAADAILAFRRRGEGAGDIVALLRQAAADGRGALADHLSYLIADTAFQRPSREIASDDLRQALVVACARLSGPGGPPGGAHDLRRLEWAQRRRIDLMEARREAGRELDRTIVRFDEEEERRIQRVRATAPAQVAERTADVVVSLTSFPARLKTVHMTIRSLLEQTVRPARIQLWLGRDEVPNWNWLPNRLKALGEHGLEVCFADRTRHQYDKILHNADLNATTPFVIVDDDVIYPPSTIAHLVEGHRAHPGAVIGNRCHEMARTPGGEIAPYAQWRREARASEPRFDLMATGVGGVLYPPGALTQAAVTDSAAFLSCAPYADDLWLKTCMLAQERPTFATALSHGSDWYHRYTPSMSEGTLMAVNVDRGLNDRQIERCAAWLDRNRPSWRESLWATSPPEAA